MELIEDWKKLAPRLWSVRLALVAALLSCLDVGYQLFLTGTPPIISLGAAFISLSAALARIVAQPKARR
jgi:hypothetical protein